MAESFEIAERFTLAAEHLRKIVASIKSEQRLLELYGLYKQATVGKCSPASKPNWYEFEAKQKWEAWNRLGDMSKEEAMSAYVESVSEISPGWEQDDDEGGDDGSRNNSWVAVSSLAFEERLLQESEKDIFDWVKEGNVAKVREYASSNNNNDINVKDAEGMGLIHWAADRGFADIVSYLSEMGVELDARDSGGQTALHYASACSHLQVVSLLLERGADPNIVCNEGCLPVDLASEDDIRSLLKSLSA